MAGFIADGNDPREFRMAWDAETPVLTARVARTVALGIAVLFALTLGVFYLLDPGAPGSALGAAAIAAGAAVLLAGLAIFGLLSNRVRTRFTVTADGYASAFSDPRLDWLRRGAARRPAFRSWDRVERIRLDAEYGRVLVQLRDEGWRAIHCPAGGFVSAAREIRRLIDEAKTRASSSAPEIQAGGVSSRPAMATLTRRAA